MHVQAVFRFLRLQPGGAAYSARAAAPEQQTRSQPMACTNTSQSCTCSPSPWPRTRGRGNHDAVSLNLGDQLVPLIYLQGGRCVSCPFFQLPFLSIAQSRSCTIFQLHHPASLHLQVDSGSSAGGSMQRHTPSTRGRAAMGLNSHRPPDQLQPAHCLPRFWRGTGWRRATAPPRSAPRKFPPAPDGHPCK